MARAVDTGGSHTAATLRLAATGLWPVAVGPLNDYSQNTSAR